MARYVFKLVARVYRGFRGTECTINRRPTCWRQEVALFHTASKWGLIGGVEKIPALSVTDCLLGNLAEERTPSSGPGQRHRPFSWEAAQ